MDENKKKIKIYDLRMDEVLENDNIYAHLIISYDLPYYLENISECYKYDLNENFFNSLKNHKRVMLFSGVRNWLENQDIYVRHSTISVCGTGFRCQTTSVIIAVQVFQDEFGDLTNIIKDESKTDELIKEIMQKTLELIIYKYNESMNGKHFISPTYLDCSMMCCTLYRNFLDEKESIWQVITPNDMVVNENIQFEDFSKSGDLNIVTWRYFYNKAKYHYLSYEYLDAIISSAICLESLSYYIMKGFLQTDEEIRLYSSEKIDDNNIRMLSVGALFKKLKNNGKIECKLSNNEMNQFIYNVLGPRNDIMHGKYSFNINLEKNSRESYNSLNKFMDSISFEDNKNLKKENNIACTYDYQRYKGLIEQFFENTNENYETNKKILKSAISIYPASSIAYVHLSHLAITEYVKSKDVMYLKEFEENIDIAMNKAKNKNQISFEKAFSYYRIGDYNNAMKSIVDIQPNEWNERVAMLISIISLSLYIENRDERNKKASIECCSTALKINSGCYLAYLIGGELAYIDENYTLAIEYYTNLYERNKGNKYILIKLLIFYFESCNYEKTLEYIEKIIDDEQNIVDCNIIMDFYFVHLSRKEVFECMDFILKKLYELGKISNDKYNSYSEKNNKFNILRCVKDKNIYGPKVIIKNKDNFNDYIIEIQLHELNAINNIKDRILSSGNI